ncbi:hypothetical protein EAH86_17670 [Pedococcus bigeumensis]|uniref:Uncharacterized protein n=1 Tax=Pedococcus bigeumensis TaxID=433644 RepID=A0A502CMH8_9MICO|nr:hypothetical protein EAH86_17670 [Pedococcus bigeumensis]
MESILRIETSMFTKKARDAVVSMSGLFRCSRLRTELPVEGSCEFVLLLFLDRYAISVHIEVAKSS